MRSAPSMLIAKTTLTVVPKTLPLFLPVRQPPMTPAISVQRIYSSRNYGDNVINWSKSFGDGTADDWDEERYVKHNTCWLSWCQGNSEERRSK
ncbi:hypothetical protein AgCh_011242 [Apium graveolens]